ncbi:class II aldolase/adducin family protein [Lederbergia citrea]|uniref:Class II aldolase/adducin family protein n=1 Tax=Lederbergia citrea TaxID=2833581 RepID=A0A942UN84_9BACI|nr:class II aldolase/adducin family protein [Lederbergia citrea]MBS4205201.1 class II aldolase/adducin family protein [Lederbergia citrea]MBS4222937.1 class II aldolase/adducin family protein [Lederbergia citrea]
MNEIQEQLQQVGRYMMENNLAWGNAGNISARIADDQYLITASGTYLGELSENDFAHCSFNGPISSSESKPSKEMPMHKAIYEERPEINAVLHASPFYSTLIACSKVDPPTNLFVESMYYLERVERVPYYHPGSVELGEAVRKQASKANILLLENHGVLVYDTSVKEARMSLQTLEMVCRMFITAGKSGIELNTLSNETVDDFLHHSGYKPKRKW